jgi:16S rRNA (cytidine1402-2'-O)-methyltransferase
LYVIATPIGNLEDLTLRAIRLLGEVDAVACEDTRRTRIIFERYKIPAPATILSYHEHNEERAGKRIVKLLEKDMCVALCSDSGYPGISDPGYRIISTCLACGYPVEVIPGAGAVSTALLASGLPTSSFTFKGYPPRKAGQVRRFLEMEQDMPHTLVFFESPKRIGKFLEIASEVFGNRVAAVCVEMTKRFERVHRGSLLELKEKLGAKSVKGEVTIVVAGNNPKFLKAPPHESG